MNWASVMAPMPVAGSGVMFAAGGQSGGVPGMRPPE
jgi:hypothetical protein